MSSICCYPEGQFFELESWKIPLSSFIPSHYMCWKKNAIHIHGPNLSQINQVQYIIPKYDSQKCATMMLVRWFLPHLSRLSKVCSIFDRWVAQNDPPNIYIYIPISIPISIPIVDDIPKIFHLYNICMYIYICVLFFLPASEPIIRPCAAATLHKRRLIYVHYISLCIPIVFPWLVIFLWYFHKIS